MLIVDYFDWRGIALTTPNCVFYSQIAEQTRMMKIHNHNDHVTLVKLILDSNECAHYGYFLSDDESFGREPLRERAVVEFSEDDLDAALAFAATVDKRFFYLVGTDDKPEEPSRSNCCAACQAIIEFVNGYKPKLRVFENAVILAKHERARNE